MHRHIIAAAILGLAASPALAEGPINLRGMGSFHIGGRTVEITGKPVREVLLGAGGVPAKLDPNGLYASSTCTCSSSCRRPARARCRC